MKNRKPTSIPEFDVIIIGGGLAGLSLACLLGQIKGLRTACIDRDAPETQMMADERTTAISSGSAKILERAGVWKKIAVQGCPIEDIEIFDGDSPLLLQFLSREVEGKPFGWIVPNRHIRDVLMRRIKTLEAVTHIAPAQVKDFQIGEDKVQVALEDGRSLKASLIVGADGRNSVVRDFMDVPVRRTDYRQSAVVCFIAHENPHHNKAVEHFWPGGPFAVLPMLDDERGRHRSSLVFTAHGRSARTLLDMDDANFQEEVRSRFPEPYGHIEVIGRRMAFPLSLAHAARYIAPRMVLVADAAHGIHPVAGQGLNLGFRDLDALSRLVAEAFVQRADIGGRELLETYQRRRRPDNTAMVAVTDALVRLFSNNLPPIRALRRFGLRGVSRISGAKRFFMVKAMGE